jgi:hypothetical protein
MGGKSRKAGRVSDALIQRLKAANPPRANTTDKVERVEKVSNKGGKK